MSDNNVSIHRQASNLGNIKGSPKGSGHGGYTIDPEVIHTTTDDMRGLFNDGKVVHLKNTAGNDYILSSFLGGDKLQGKFVCPIKLNAARNNNNTTNLEDIISTEDTINVDEVKISNVFLDEEEAANYFLMNTEQIEFESMSNFDKTLNKIYMQLIN